MDELPRNPQAVDPARSFDLVADAYDRARPSYPDDAVTAVLRDVADAPDVVELGAGTGKLTEQLLARGARVTATDPSEAMLGRLRRRAPAASALAGAAEQVPLRGRSADLVVAAQAFHWFDADRALREVARVLRPGGAFAVVWSSRDERIPWVRRLGRLIGSTPESQDPTAAVDETGMFAAVERSTFRFWQPLEQDSLHDLVVSRSRVAVMSDGERDRLLRKVEELYEEYGRGHDGMLLPYVTTVCRTTVLPWAVTQEAEPPGSPDAAASGPSEGPDDDALLIDFR